MHWSIVGRPGSGKSVISQRFVEQCVLRGTDGKPVPHERIFSTVPLEGHDAPVVVVAGSPEEAKETGKPYMYDVTCGVLFIDELHDYLPAREFDKLSPKARKFWSRHRHRDLMIVSNTQHPSFLDKYCRIITDRVLLTELVAVPLLGALFPKTVRPPDACHLRPGFPHARRDALGDRATAAQRLLRTGALIRWNEYPPSVLNDSESLDMNFLEEQGIKSKGGGFMLFDMKYAGMARHTVHASASPPLQAALLA